jgi:elongation factor 1-gamma
MAYTLHSYPGNPRAFKALVTAQYAGIKIDVPATFEMAQTKTEAFLSRFPAGQVPALDTPDGPVWESNAIAKYVARKGGVLYGATPYEASVVDAWIDWCAKIDTALGIWVYPILGYLEFNAAATEAAKQDLSKLLTILNNHLLTHTYLVGESVTLAYVVLCSSLFTGFRMVFDAKFRKPFTNVVRWFSTVVRQPNFAAVAGPLNLCAEAQVFVPKAAPAAAAPAAAPAAASSGAGQEDDDEEKPVKKAPNPLDLLPPTKLNLEEFKRVYSNNLKDVRGTVVPWLWEHYEADGWSIWFADYLFNKDLTKMFMTSNLTRGFVQRLESARKYAFGVIITFGEDNKSEIHAVFMVRGTDRPPELSVEMCEDCDSYTWRKADPTNAEDKALIEDFLDQEGKFGGKFPAEVADVKVFK